MLFLLSAETTNDEGGEDFQEAARVALAFLRQSKEWLEKRFGKLKYDPWVQKIDTYLFVPNVSTRYRGSSPDTW